MLLSDLLAALAAAGNALANVMQRRAGLEQAPELRFGRHMIGDLIKRRVWLLGFGGMVASFGLQAAALNIGALSSVEAIITLEVPLTMLVASRVFHVRLGRAEWSGVFVMTAGMITLVVALRPRAGNESNVSHSVYAAAGGGTAATIAALILVALRRPGVWRTVCLGAATGTSFGLTATLIKETMAQLNARGSLGVVTTWQTYAAISCGVFGVLVMQWALHSGPLLAAQPGFTLMDPLVSILWGVLVYREPVRDGWWLVPAALGAVAVMVGLPMLARSPLLAATGRPAAATTSA